ncbi:MAG: metal ABC transporter substrate-binding protein, partial [Nanoarchaeota archaeon]
MQSDKLTILASTFPLYEFAKEIAPNENVQMIIPPGVDIHHYELKPSDIRKIDNADLIIYLGEDAEPWLESVLDIEGKHKNKTINAIQEVDDLIKTNDAHDDEHVADESDDEHVDDES